MNRQVLGKGCFYETVLEVAVTFAGRMWSDALSTMMMPGCYRNHLDHQGLVKCYLMQEQRNSWLVESSRTVVKRGL